MFMQVNFRNRKEKFWNCEKYAIQVLRLPFRVMYAMYILKGIYMFYFILNLAYCFYFVLCLYRLKSCQRPLDKL